MLIVLCLDGFTFNKIRTYLPQGPLLLTPYTTINGEHCYMLRTAQKIS